MSSTHEHQGQAERGSAMILTLVVIMMLMTMVLVTSQGALMRSHTAIEGGAALGAINATDVAIGLRLEQIRDADGAVTPGSTTYDLPDFGRVVVVVENLGENGVDDDGDGQTDAADKKELGILRMTARATSKTIGAGGKAVTRGAEVYLRKRFHELFYKAIYVGNETDAPFTLNLGPGSGTPQGGGGQNKPNQDAPTADDDYPGSSWENWVQNGDFVDGDVHVNGDSILITGQTDIYGQVDATGKVVGSPVNGDKSSGVASIPPPDLKAQDYETLAADPAVGGGVWRMGDTGLPKWLYDYGPNMSSDPGYDYDADPNNYNPYDYLVDEQDYSSDNFHFGGPKAAIEIEESDHGKIFVIKGNLWIDNRGTTEFNFPNGGRQLTIVVEGNLYISDGLSYEDKDDAILFIIKGSDDNPESYVDANGNNIYDAGEQILHDDGDGVYEGPKEGQGNIYFGDMRAPKGGVTDGYFYAENNVYINPTRQDRQAYGVNGFLSAGHQMVLGNRASGRSYPSLRVKYDARLENGAVEFPGMPAPQGGGFKGLQVVLWRQVP